MNNSTTPSKRGNLRRISLLRNTTTTPLRKSNVGANGSSLEPLNDEEEILRRRSEVALQRQLTNISQPSQSPLVDNCAGIKGHQIIEMMRTYTEMNAQNRISLKNVWQVHIIDLIDKVVSTDTPNLLQLAGSSIDLGAKVYALRIDNIYDIAMKLTSSVNKGDGKKQQTEGEGDEEMNVDVNQETRRRNVRKKSKKIAEDKRNTIDKEEKTFYGSIKHVESDVFATKENIDASATDNLFTSKLLVNPSNHQFMLLNTDKYWTYGPDKALDKADEILTIEIPRVAHYRMCSSFKDFEIGNWDVEEEERLFGRSCSNLPDVVLDENGIPVVDLDGSVHDIFADDNDIPEDPTSDAEEHNELLQTRIHGEIAEIVDAVPEEIRTETDYGYNPFVRTPTGQYIDKLWAGPSHWKVKFNRRSSARYSGSVVEKVARHTKKKKTPVPCDYFAKEAPDIMELYGKWVPKRVPPTTTFEKCTLPVPDLFCLNFYKMTENLLSKPGVPIPRRNNNVTVEEQECEVQVYNYENPNDSQYCSQNNSEPMDNDHSFEEEISPFNQQHFMEDNLVNAPELAAATPIPYALRAKKMDMKKLKTAVWKRITLNDGDKNSQATVVPTRFSELYEKLPEMLSGEMRKELTCPLALVALLHLCNENNLNLCKDGDENDFTIVHAEN